MKNLIRYILQRVLGFSNYLFLFSIITIKRLKHNPYEQEFLYFVDIIPDEGIILDIGANIGITTVPLAQGKKNAVVYSFEPMPENIQALKRVIKFFGLSNVNVFETALGDSTGELKMIMPVVNNVKMQGLSYIAPDDIGDGTIQGNELKVPVARLDDIKELVSAPKISAIKIDVENFEYFVFKGAKELLSVHKPLIYCELWDNEKRKLSIDYLKELGYQVKIYSNGTLTDIDGQPGINFFFIPVN